MFVRCRYGASSAIYDVTGCISRLVLIVDPSYVGVKGFLLRRTETAASSKCDATGGSRYDDPAIP